MAGRLIYVMGPSGSGKDSVIQGALERLGPSACVAPRVITRQVSLAEPWARSVSKAEFAALEHDGKLAMAWRANGLAYGVMRDIDDRLMEGCDVFVNGSRQYLDKARERYPSMVPVLLQVEPQLLRQRLESRGRENQAQIHARLARNRQIASLCSSAQPDLILIDNSGCVEAAVHALHACLGDTKRLMRHHEAY